jgi:hypothetical protein
MTHPHSRTTTAQLFTRRHFLRRGSQGLGWAALATLLADASSASGQPRQPGGSSGLEGLPHFAPRARHVIFLHQSGAPSQIELFDYKPQLDQRHGQEIPASVQMDQRLTTMTRDQATKPLTRSLFRFARHGQCGAEISELLPYTAQIADDLCIVRSLYTEAINHDPAITFLQTGSQQPGRPSLGAWVHYGLGSENANLPAFVVMISGGRPGDQPLYGRLWGSGFLPAQYQAVQLRSGGDPLLFLHNPPGIDPAVRRTMIDAQAAMNQWQYELYRDPEIAARIEQYELAFRLQAAAPELVDLSQESEQVLDQYGPEVRQPGSFAANCLLARRLVERGVRFVQLYHRDWDHHSHLPSRLKEKCLETDQASAALVSDLKQRGLLKDTLVVWAGEFGRTAFCQGELTADDYGRDHHPRCFSIWMAGGGVRSGMTFGTTDEFSYNVVENPVHVHDLQATILHLLGIDHERLTYQHQGRHFRLTDIAGRAVRKVVESEE